MASVIFGPLISNLLCGGEFGCELKGVPSKSLANHLELCVSSTNHDMADISLMAVIFVARDGRLLSIYQRPQGTPGISPVSLACFRGVCTGEANSHDTAVSGLQLESISVMIFDDMPCRFESLIGRLCEDYARYGQQENKEAF